jgi:hypothetical protein
MMKLDGWVDGGQHDEFQVISYRDSMESIKGFAGSDIRRTPDMPCARSSWSTRHHSCGTTP